MASSGKVIKVQKIPRRQPKPTEALELLAELCYYYPAYTLRAARQLPYKHVALMVRKARQLQARHYYQMAQVAAAPHTDKGIGVKELLTKYAKEMNG